MNVITDLIFRTTLDEVVWSLKMWPWFFNKFIKEFWSWVNKPLFVNKCLTHEWIYFDQFCEIWRRFWAEIDTILESISTLVWKLLKKYCLGNFFMSLIFLLMRLTSTRLTWRSPAIDICDTKILTVSLPAF